MIVDCVADSSLWPQEIPLTQEEGEAIAGLNPGDRYSFRETDYIFVGKSEKRTEWISLA